MSTPRRINPELETSHELLRLACGDAGGPSAALRARLEDSAALREQLEEAADLVGTLRSALSPAPLPPDVEARIHVALDQFPTAHRAWTWPLRLAGSAAAACLLAALLLPWHTGSAPGGSLPAEIDLTEADAAVIVAAHWDLCSETLTDYSVGALEQCLETTLRRLERDPDTASVLPWGPDDDWDMPRVSPQRSETDDSRLCGTLLRGGLWLDGVPS